MEPPRETLKWILFFPLGTDMDKFFCRFTSASAETAKSLAWSRYPTHVVRIVPDDTRAAANIRTYQKIEIPFGAILKLTQPEVEPDESVGGN